MIWAIVILGLAFLYMTMKNILYKRQVGDICQQLRFNEKNKSQMCICIGMSDKSLVELSDILTDMNEKTAKRENMYKSKEKMLKDAITNVSHDIRTPLTSMKGFFELLCIEDDPKERERYEGIMKERIDTLADLLEELFTYTKLVDYEQELVCMDVTKPLLETLFSFYEEIQEKCEKTDITMQEKPVMIMGNEMAVKRMEANLIKNALVHGNGQLQITYDLMPDQKSIKLSVANTVDNPEEIEVSQVFDRFYKADKARSKSSTGLGLAIAKQCIEAMNGSISARISEHWFIIDVLLPTVDS